MATEFKFKFIVKYALFLFISAYCAVFFSGCSAGQKGLLTITPTQYFYSAKEQLETIDERAYEIRDLDEIIRVLENAEKDAKKSEIIDKSRLYLVLANTLKARKQYQNSLMKGEYLANRAEPFYVVNTKEVKETLRTAKKWLRSCRSTFKTNSLVPDLNFVEGLYYTQKMLTQHSREKQGSLAEAIKAFRTCAGMAPDYKSDFRIFGKTQTIRELRLKLVETLALGKQLFEAHALLSEFNFAPISTIPGATDKQDYAWNHMNGLVLAMMGQYEEAAELLNIFKIVSPQEYPMVDEALWVLEGVFDRLKEETDDEKYGMEARIVAAMLKKLKGPYSKETYSTSANLLPKLLPGDITFFKSVIQFHAGKFDDALKTIEPLLNRGIMSRQNRNSAKLLTLESYLYSGKQITDDLLESLLQVATNRDLTDFQKERAGYILARYVMDSDNDFKRNKINHSGQTFAKCITSKPWALSLKYLRGEIKKPSSTIDKRKNTDEEEEGQKREASTIIGEMYANRPNDWIVSANLHILALPELNLIGKGRIVGREEENKGWMFKSREIDEMKRRKNYLLIFEYDNSDSEKSIQGVIYRR